MPAGASKFYQSPGRGCARRGFLLESPSTYRKTSCRMKKTSPGSRSGRFSSGPGGDAAKFTESISFDGRLWRHDLMGSIAHATMLGGIGVLTKAEAKRIVRALEAIGDDIEAGFLLLTDGDQGGIVLGLGQPLFRHAP